MNHRRPLFAGPPRAGGARADVRLRVDERQPLLPSLCAHQLLLLQLRTRLLRAAAGARAGDPGALPRRNCRRVLLEQEFRLPATDGSGNNREDARRALDLLRQAGWTVRDRRLTDAQGTALRIRDPAERPLLRARRPALRPGPAAPGHRGARAHRGPAAVPGAHGRLRLRHDGVGVRPVRLSRQRAARLLGLRRGRQNGSQNTLGIKRPGGGRAGGTGDLRRPTAPNWSRAPTRWTACCSGATTSSRSITAAPSASPGGTSSAGPSATRSAPSGWTRGGWTRRSEQALNEAAPELGLTPWAPTSSAAAAGGADACSASSSSTSPSSSSRPAVRSSRCWRSCAARAAPPSGA